MEQQSVGTYKASSDILVLLLLVVPPQTILTYPLSRQEFSVEQPHVENGLTLYLQMIIDKCCSSACACMF